VNDDLRADPDKLWSDSKQESQQKRGKLKIFLGMRRGRQDYAMLEARANSSPRVDVVIGYVETTVARTPTRSCRLPLIRANPSSIAA